MSLRWPDLELLRRGRGDLIALSRLSQPAIRDRMTAALRRLPAGFAQRGSRAPELAIIDALAACAEIMGFYHDRFLTESKLGSAQLLDDLARLVALIGYRPRPAVAATAFQFFEAIRAGSVAASTRVAGRVSDPPAIVTFETDALIEVNPALNRMAMSPIITRHAGAQRVILARDSHGALPTDDFLPHQLAMVADRQGLELATIHETRSRGVAFDRGLSRSFEPTAVLSRATVIRNLRDPRALAGDLVAFEVSDGPIMHLPELAAPERPRSTLELFVLRPGDEQLDPSTWDPALRYQEVSDFSASEVSDLHYRTFVDDALHTWIVLRTRLGSHELLDTAALGRVHVRFVPAVGSVLAPAADGTARTLHDVTVGLDRRYFATSVVPPPTADHALVNATWAMVDRDLGLLEGDSILIHGPAGQRWVRTLGKRPPGASPRLLSWEASPDASPGGADRPEAHEPITCALDPATTKIGSIADAASGAAFPTWTEFYAQLAAPGAFESATDLPIVPASAVVPSGKLGVIERSRVIAAGATYLVLRDATHVSVGDFLLIGQRLAAPLRVLQPSGPWRWRPGEPAFDPRTPWRNAEVVQVLEVRGNVVRLVTPVSQDYVRHRGWAPGAAVETPLSEVVALPGVVSVASGDQLRQELQLSTHPVYRGSDDQLHEASYAVATLEAGSHGFTAGALRRPLLDALAAHPEAVVALSPPPGKHQQPPDELWRDLFVAVAGVAEVQTQVDWRFTVVVPGKDLPPAGVFSHFAHDGHAAVRAPRDGALTDEVVFDAPLAVVSAAAAARLASARVASVIAVFKDQPSWLRVDGAPGRHEFRIAEAASFELVPAVRDPAADALLADGGVVTVIASRSDAEPAARWSWPFAWDDRSGAPRAVASAPVVTGPFEAILVSDRLRVDLDDGAMRTATVDWLVPGRRFAPGFRPTAARSLAVVSAGGQLVREHGVTWRDDGLELHGVPVLGPADPIQRLVDPLDGGASVWAVDRDEVRIAPSAVQTSWQYQLETDRDRFPGAGPIRLALAGERGEIVDARATDDGRTAIVDPGYPARDLGAAFDALYTLEVSSIAGPDIAESTIWTWQGIDPPLIDLPEPGDSQFLAQIPARGDRHLTWSRAEVWWEPERRTLRLPIRGAAATCRPSDVVRLIQLLAPPIERARFTVEYDLVSDRSIVTMAIAPGWPVSEIAPAPVVAATRDDGTTEIVDLAGPVELFTAPGGGVRWNLYVAGDVRDRWADVSVVVRDWSAPAERGLAAAPLWRVTAPAWRAARPGPVTLFATTARSQLRRLPAMLRSDGDALALVPLGRDDDFPAAALVDQLDLAVREIARTAEAAVALRASIAFDLTADRSAGALSHVVFVSGDRWHPVRVTRTTPSSGGNDRHELDSDAYLALFPEGLAGEQRVRLCYGTSQIAGDATAQALTLGLALPGLAGAPGTCANAAVFHGDDSAAGIALDTRSAPSIDGDRLAIALALGDTGLDALVDDHGAPRWRWLSLARRWPGLAPAAVQPGPCLIELGDPGPYPLVAGVELEVRTDDGIRRVAAQAAYAGDGLHLAIDAGLAPHEITLRGMRVAIAEASYGAELVLVPTSQQPPWLLSFSSERHPAALADTVLPYRAAEVIDQATGQLRFTFGPGAEVAEIFRSAGDPSRSLYLLTNERDELRSDFYLSRTSELVNDLGSEAPPNFLTAPDRTRIDRLVVRSSAWAAAALDRPRPILICSARWRSSSREPRLPLDRFPELRVVAARRRRIRTGFVLHSMRFNSGNFIPVAGQTRTPENTAAVVASAVRISALPVDREGKPVPGAAWRQVSYCSLEALTERTAALATKVGSDSLAAIAGVAAPRPSETGWATAPGHSYAFSASFSAAGVCTLHLLFVDDALAEHVQVRIETQYGVSPGRSGDLAGALYPFESEIVAFDPTTQLAILGPGSLKPGALVFVRTAKDDQTSALQWTQVSRINGPIVDLKLPIASPPRPDLPLEPIEVTAVGKLDSAAQLDAEYYAAMAKARLAPAPRDGLVLTLRDRLPLDVLTRGHGDSSPASSLIPGDPVLVFDDRYRKAWAEQRTRGRISAVDWHQWPDFQHLGFVKQIDAAAGLLVLDAPLPERFQIRWQLDRAARRWVALDDDIAAVRVLPHHGAPVQGARTLAVLGSGNAAHRFPRFVSSLDAGTGSAVIPLAPPGVTVGNVEVLSFDPEKGTWTRWLRHGQLAGVDKKAPAFVLGFRPIDRAGRVPVSVTFGDGLTGRLLPTGTDNVYLRATRIGAAEHWLPQRRRVTIVARHGDTRLPFALASSTAPARNLLLELACAAPAELVGTGDPARVSWQPTIELVVEAPDGKPCTLREISRADASAGKQGFYRSSSPDMSPGIIRAHLCVLWPVADDADVEAWYVPAARQWRLDDKLHRDAELDKRDPSAGPGATSLQLLETTGLRPGSWLALCPDSDSPPDIVRLASIDPPTWTARLEERLTRSYGLARSFIRGNVVRIVQGSVERIALGSSDGTTRSLRLPLDNRALLYIDRPGGDPEPDIAVLIAAQARDSADPTAPRSVAHRWDRVLDFEGQTPSSRVWRLDIDAGGAPAIVFGDGERGAIPPAGRDHIEAVVRIGSGAAGNLPAGAIDKLVTDNLAIRSTANLTNAAGGSAGDTPAVAREKAYRRHLASDRVVSASDCVRVAIGHNEVLSAALDPSAGPGTLRLVVALDGRRAVTDEIRTAVCQQVSDAMPVATRVRLEVAEARQTPVHVIVRIDVLAGHVQADVFLQVRTAFRASAGGFFAADRWDIGEPLRVGAIYDAIFQIAGVAHARVVWMAGAPHRDGEPVPAAAPDVFDPGPTGVVRCDSDPSDPLGRLGAFRIEHTTEPSP